MPQGKHCDEETAKELERYWKMRERDLKAMYMTYDCSAKELTDFLKDEGIEIPNRKEFDNEDEWREALEELVSDRKYDYGLGIDIVEPCTFSDQPDPYLLYQFSWGGGQDEIRFYFSIGDDTFDYAEYWYLNWGTGCYIDISTTPLAMAIWDDLHEILYEKFNELQNKGCEAYEDCDPKYVPEECKDYVLIAEERIDKMSDSEILEASEMLFPQEIKKAMEDVLEENDFPNLSEIIQAFKNNESHNNIERVMERIRRIDSDAYDDIIETLRDELKSQVEYDEDDAYKIYERWGD